MARRLALLALLACACAAPASYSSQYSSESASDSFDPFVLLDDYDDSFEPTQRPKTSAKVILRTKGSKVNASVTYGTYGAYENYIPVSYDKFSKISPTRIVWTERPAPAPAPASSVSWLPAGGAGLYRPVVEVSPQFVLVGAGAQAGSTRRPHKPRRRAGSTTRRPRTTPRPARTTTARTTTRATTRATTRRPPTTTTTTTTTTRKPPRTTRRPSFKTTKKPQKNKVRTTCPPKTTAAQGWFSSYFQQQKKKKKPDKKPSNSTWFFGVMSKIYTWIWGSGSGASSWLGGGWFAEPPSPPPRTSTAAPPPATTADWFHSLLESEEDDGAYVVNNTKKSPKKMSKKTYKGYQLLRAYPDVAWKVHSLLELQEEAEGSGVRWWSAPSLNATADIVVPPDLLEDVKDHLKSSSIDFDVVIWDLQKAIAYENPRLSKKQRLELEAVRGHPLTWRRYHRYADVLRYLEYLQHARPDLLELLPLGRSSEGLPLVAVKISLPQNDSYAREPSAKNKKKWQLRSRMKPAVWLEGGAHAREWIAPAVATWILHALVEGENGLGAEYETLRAADFYIMPVVNPDGYEHSHTHDRLWRKTRSRHADGDDYYNGWFPWNWGQTDCVGVDPDRNWDYHWGEMGASRDPCSDHFAGPHPFSEPETRAVSNFLAEHRHQIKVYISLHAYSQSWLVPSSPAHAQSDDGALMEMGRLATAALADMYGTKYRVGTAAELRQPAAGMAHDWAKARAGVKYAYHVDLRDSFGPYGFLLPGSQIVATARETWQAVRAIVDNLTP